jgi:tetratricopeptide (TPR) repeat protein
MYSLALTYEWVGRVPDTLALYHEILKYRMAAFGPDHAKTLACLNSIAISHRKAGQWVISVPLLEQVVARRRSVLGATHPSTLDSMLTLAANYDDVGRHSESLAICEKVLDYRRSALGPDHEDTIGSMVGVAYARQWAGQIEHADRFLREALLHSRKRNDSKGRLATADLLDLLGLNLLLQQEYAAAESFVREALATYEKEEPDHWRRFHIMSVLGGVLLGQHRYAAAEPLLLQAHEGLKQREWIMIAPWRYRIAQAAERIVRFYEATNQPEKAKDWREKLPSTSYPGPG